MRHHARIRNVQKIKKGLARFAVLGVAVFGLTACKDLLDVELPGDLVEEDVFTEENAQLLVNSAIADFECAYSMMSATLGSMGDSYWPGTGGTFGGSHGDYEQETPGGGNCPENDNVGSSWWHGYERSRLFSETAYERLQTDWTGAVNRDELMATAAVYAGIYYDFIGSVFCEYAFPEGGVVPPSTVLATGEQWLTDALGVMGTGDFSIASTTSLKQLAYLLRARIRRTLGDNAGASADALMVQPGFEAFVTRDGSERGRWNELNYFWNSFKYRTVAGPTWWLGFDDDSLVAAGMWDLTLSDDGFGLPTVGNGVPDTRVPETNVGTPIVDGNTPWHRQDVYTSNADHQRMASWQEAQLILAEIEGGASAVSRINAVRAAHTASTLPSFSSSDPAEIFSVIVEERRREFFLQGARHYMDKLRYGLWFPRGRGTNRIGDLYGFAYCMIPPENVFALNPNVTADYVGPDLTNPAYTWELQVAGPVWPIPATLPQFDVMDPDAIPWTQW